MKILDPRKLFAHKQAIRSLNQKFFAGRRSILERAYDGLGVSGSAAVIFGERGVGKTSLAWQLLEGFCGNETLLTKLDVKPKLPIEKHNCLWIQCRKSMVDLHGALICLLRKGQSADRTFPKAFPELFKAKKRAGSVERTYKLGLPIANATLKYADHHDKVRRAELPEEILRNLGNRNAQIEDIFFEVLGSACENQQREVMIFLDEFDRLPITEGAGEFLKACNDAKIVVIGVADHIDEILKDHRSIERKLVGTKFNIPNLQMAEVEELFANAEDLAQKAGFDLNFEPEFVRRVFESCDGYPHHVQLIGYAAVFEKLHQKGGDTIAISEKDFDSALDHTLYTADGELEIFEMIKEGIADSQNRAKILIKMAEHEPGWMQESYAHKALGRSAAKHFESHLSILDRCGLVLRDSATDRVKFKTPAIRSVVRLAGRSRLMPE